jgi:uncharacterized protein YpmS
MEEKTKKFNKSFISFLATVFVFMIVVGFSYAYWRKTIIQANPNTVTTLSCLSTTITDTTSAINLVDEYAITDEEGMTKTPYTFTITNGCTNYVKVAINLESLSTSTLDASHIKASLNTAGVSYPIAGLLSNKTTATATNSGATSYVLNTGVYLAPNASKSFDLRVWIDNDTSSADGMNKVFNGKIVLSYEPKENYSTNGELFAWTHSGETTANGGMKLIKQPATTNMKKTTEYRYYGSNPNNYISFNDELWRIIGVFEVQNEAGNYEYRLKLIRNDSIGNYSWDTSASTVNSGYGINEWSQADLMKLLNPGYETNTDLNNSGSSITVNNSLYWTKGSGTCYSGQSNTTTTCDFTTTGLGATAKSMIDKTKYYIGGGYSATTTTQFYTYERGSNVVIPGTTCNGTYCNDTVTRTTTWTGYVGLPYVSDYGYATDESICLSTEYVDYNITTGYLGHAYCHTNDWLWNNSNDYWTIVPASFSSIYVWLVYSNGSVDHNGASSGYVARPTLYLKPDIAIASGTGTSTDPYVIGA